MLDRVRGKHFNKQAFLQCFRFGHAKSGLEDGSRHVFVPLHFILIPFRAIIPTTGARRCETQRISKTMPQIHCAGKFSTDRIQACRVVSLVTEVLEPFFPPGKFYPIDRSRAHWEPGAADESQRKSRSAKKAYNITNKLRSTPPGRQNNRAPSSPSWSIISSRDKQSERNFYMHEGRIFTWNPRCVDCG